MGVFFTTRERSAPAGLPLVREILKDAIPTHTTARTTDARIPRASLTSSIGTEYYPRRPACAIRHGDEFPARRHSPRSPEDLRQPGVLGAGRRRGERRPAGPGARSGPRAERPEGGPSHLSHHPAKQTLPPLAATTAPRSGGRCGPVVSATSRAIDAKGGSGTNGKPCHPASQRKGIPRRNRAWASVPSAVRPP